MLAKIQLPTFYINKDFQHLKLIRTKEILNELYLIEGKQNPMINEF